MTARIVPPEGGWPPFEDAYQAQFLSDAIAHAQAGVEGLEGAELAVILVELERLQAMERRALSEADHDDTQGREARYILTGEKP